MIETREECYVINDMCGLFEVMAIEVNELDDSDFKLELAKYLNHTIGEFKNIVKEASPIPIMENDSLQ